MQPKDGRLKNIHGGIHVLLNIPKVQYTPKCGWMTSPLSFKSTVSQPWMCFCKSMSISKDDIFTHPMSRCICGIGPWEGHRQNGCNVGHLGQSSDLLCAMRSSRRKPYSYSGSPCSRKDETDNNKLQQFQTTSSCHDNKYVVSRRIRWRTRNHTGKSTSSRGRGRKPCTESYQKSASYTQTELSYILSLTECLRGVPSVQSRNRLSGATKFQFRQRLINRREYALTGGHSTKPYNGNCTNCPQWKRCYQRCQLQEFCRT